MKIVNKKPEHLVINGDIVLKEEERQACEVWTRVMGYHRPSFTFNVGKKGEFKDRKYFKEKKENKNG